TVFGAQAASAPAAVAASAGRVLVGWLGLDGSFHYRYQAGFAWSPTQTLAGPFALDQTPALAASSAGTIHLFLRMPSGRVTYYQHLHHPNERDRWVGPIDLGGAVVGRVSAASPALERVDVFARSSDNRLLRNTWTGGTTFSGWLDDGV